jgi:hypothetical protein
LTGVAHHGLLIELSLGELFLARLMCGTLPLAQLFKHANLSIRFVEYLAAALHLLANLFDLRGQLLPPGPQHQLIPVNRDQSIDVGRPGRSQPPREMLCAFVLAGDLVGLGEQRVLIAARLS